MCFSRVQRSWRGGRRAFSFIEVMIVVVIIGVLAGTVTLASKHYLDRAKRSRAKADIATYQSALASFYADAGRYPTTDEGLAVLVPKFIDRVRSDPWGRPYGYACPGRTGAYEVTCLGADGREGGDGADADISSDDLDAKETDGTAGK
jgi:general secretion pathway protein G